MGRSYSLRKRKEIKTIRYETVGAPDTSYGKHFLTRRSVAFIFSTLRVYTFRQLAVDKIRIFHFFFFSSQHNFMYSFFLSVSQRRFSHFTYYFSSPLSLMRCSLSRCALAKVVPCSLRFVMASSSKRGTRTVEVKTAKRNWKLLKCWTQNSFRFGFSLSLYSMLFCLPPDGCDVVKLCNVFVAAYIPRTHWLSRWIVMRNVSSVDSFTASIAPFVPIQQTICYLQSTTWNWYDNIRCHLMKLIHATIVLRCCCGHFLVPNEGYIVFQRWRNDSLALWRHHHQRNHKMIHNNRCDVVCNCK